MHTKGPSGALPLLHIDDSANERFLVRRAIEATNTPLSFYGVDCIESAVSYFEQRPSPAIVLLDYDIGRHTGVDFLVWLRVMKNITSVPVAMFTGSVGKNHVAECYCNGANYFLSKPKNSARLQKIVRALHESLVLSKPSVINALEEFHPAPREQRTTQKAL